MQTESLLGDQEGETLIVSGDTPLFTAATFNKMFEYHEQRHAAVTILTSVAPDPTGYGRIVRNDVGIVERIVEQKMPRMKNRKFMKSIPVSTALTIKSCFRPLS